MQLLREAQLPAPEPGVRLGVYTLDFLWREERVVFEIDGYKYHTSRSAFMRDRRKDGVVKAAGLDMNRIARDQLIEEPYAVIARVARMIARG